VGTDRLRDGHRLNELELRWLKAEGHGRSVEALLRKAKPREDTY
jgi:hypothetical protein